MFNIESLPKKISEGLKRSYKNRKKKNEESTD